jgi:hypothetical protein
MNHQKGFRHLEILLLFLTVLADFFTSTPKGFVFKHKYDIIIYGLSNFISFIALLVALRRSFAWRYLNKAEADESNVIPSIFELCYRLDALFTCGDLST